MMKEYCKFCWAKSSDKCVCVKENRLVNCKKAMERADTHVITTNKEWIGLRDYLKYISNRIEYLKISKGDIPSNEYKYYYLLRKKIHQWGEEHIVFYKYILGKITIHQAKTLCGVSYRQMYRIFSQQRKNLICYIEEQENLLGGKYPYIPTVEVIDRVMEGKQ